MSLRISKTALKSSRYLEEMRELALELWNQNIKLQAEVDTQGAANLTAVVEPLKAEVAKLKAERASSADREYLGQLARIAWMKWASEQPNPKPSWLVPWEELSEAEREADRQIGEYVAARCVTPELLKVEAEVEQLKAKIEELQGIVDAAIRWRSAELHHAACVLGIRRRSIEEAETKKLARTANLQIVLDEYRRSTRKVAEAAKGGGE